MRQRFTSEAKLVEDFVFALDAAETPWGASFATETEFDYARGRADVVGVSSGGEVIAFEAKLVRWRDALHQAYRNTCFAHRSYVLVPECIARRAASRIGEFERRGVGLCSIGAEGLTVVHDAPRREPIQPWLSEAAVAHVVGDGHDS